MRFQKNLAPIVAIAQQRPSFADYGAKCRKSAPFAPQTGVKVN
jgi:hypothetical protein